MIRIDDETTSFKVETIVADAGENCSQLSIKSRIIRFCWVEFSREKTERFRHSTAVLVKNAADVGTRCIDGEGDWSFGIRVNQESGGG